MTATTALFIAGLSILSATACFFILMLTALPASYFVGIGMLGLVSLSPIVVFVVRTVLGFNI